jgi:hypothetical protein
MTLILVLSKIITPNTSLPTSATSLFIFMELAIWIFLLSLLTKNDHEIDVDYDLPLALNSVALVCFIIGNGLFFYFNNRRVKEDDYVRIWLTNNVNYTVFVVIRYLALFLGFKFYRIIYSKLFDILQFSLGYKKYQHVFPLATIFTLFNLILCEIPMIIASFTLIYNKRMKDQTFYTCVECLTITIITIIVSLVDIYKTEDYFEDSQFLQMKRYLDKVRDLSLNQVE